MTSRQAKVRVAIVFAVAIVAWSSTVWVCWFMEPKPKPPFGITTTTVGNWDGEIPQLHFYAIQHGVNTEIKTKDDLPPGYTLHTNLLGQWACKDQDGKTVKHTWNYITGPDYNSYSCEEVFDARTTAVYYAWETYSNDLQTARERAAHAETQRKQNTWFITESGRP